MYMGYLWPFSVERLKVILGSFGALVSKWPVTRKQLSIEQNGLKFGVSRVVLTCIWVTFDRLVFKVILGSFDALVSN